MLIATGRGQFDNKPANHRAAPERRIRTMTSERRAPAGECRSANALTPRTTRRHTPRQREKQGQDACGGTEDHGASFAALALDVDQRHISDGHLRIDVAHDFADRGCRNSRVARNT